MAGLGGGLFEGQWSVIDNEHGWCPWESSLSTGGDSQRGVDVEGEHPVTELGQIKSAKLVVLFHCRFLLPHIFGLPLLDNPHLT